MEMKTRFEKFNELANDTAAFAKRTFFSAQKGVGKAGAATEAARKAARQSMGAAVERSGEFIRNAFDHEHTRVTTTKTKAIATATANDTKILAHDVVEVRKASEKSYAIPEPVAAQDIEDAIHTLKGKDKVGRIGDVLGTTGGIVAGSAAAGSVAGVVGVSTLLGSPTLASALGGVFVVATPVGWVVGSALVGAAAGYGITKMIRSGSRQDQVRDAFIERQSRRLDSISGKDSEQARRDELRLRLPEAIKGGLVTKEQAERMICHVENGTLSAGIALTRIDAILAPK